MIKKAFSLVELMVTLIVLSCIIAAMTPTITKKLKSQGITVGSGGGGKNVSGDFEFSQDCSAFGEDCALCFNNKCSLCSKSCLANEYVDTPTCTCQSCDKFDNCLECNVNQCKKCENGYFINGLACEICPVGSFCDGIEKTTCPEGKYTGSEGQTSCTTCEVGYACSNGIK